MFFVLNCLRPDTSNIEDIVSLANNIELTSRAKISALINNTNLSYLTESHHLTDSLEFSEKAARELGVELKYITGIREILNSLPTHCKDKAMEIELFMKLPFDAMA